MEVAGGHSMSPLSDDFIKWMLIVLAVLTTIIAFVVLLPH
jgi:hypothetical protein